MDLVKDSYIAFVNLEHRKDRLQHMATQLGRVDLEAIRHEGLLPDQVDVDPSKVAVMRNRTPGAIGCHYSQVGIMEKALELNKHAWVMEDDIVFCSDFDKRLKISAEFLTKADWDVLWLGGTFHSPAFWHPDGPSKMSPDCSMNLGKDCDPTDNPNIMRTYGAFSTFAYIVNRDRLPKILKMLDARVSVSIGIDWLFISIQPMLNCFAFVPGCVKQMDNQSDIGDGITMFSGFSKLNGTEENSAYWYQDYMEDFPADKWTWK